MARARLNAEDPPQLPPVSAEVLTRMAAAPAGQASAGAGGEAGAPAESGLASQPDVALPPGVPAPQPLCLIECGDFAWFDQPFPELRAKTHLEVLKSLGCVAAVPGSAELKFTLEQALSFMQDSPVPLVSCNLTAKDKKLGFSPSVELVPGWYLVGVTSWAPATGSFPKDTWWELSDPPAAVMNAIGSLPRGSRIVVSALHQPPEMLSALAALPGVDVVIGAEDQKTAGAKQLLAPPRRGTSLRLASLSAAGGDGVAIKPWEVQLSENWPDWPAVMKIFHDEQEQLRLQILANRGVDVRVRDWRKVDWGQSGKYLPGEAETAAAENSYTGPERCRDCHPGPYAAWKVSRHSRALVSLARSGDQQNIDCLKCHVTALLQPGGYNPYDDRPELGWVGCENCHGPGAAHADKMAKWKKAQAGKAPGAAVAGDTGIERGSVAACVSCHDDYNSPGFDQAKGWAAVKH